MIVRNAFRGFSEGRLLFEDLIIAEDGEPFERAVEQAMQAHAEEILAHEKHVIEVEDLDEPDPMQRFTRFGTDPDGMTIPIKLDFGN